MGRKPNAFVKLKERVNVAESTVPTVTEVHLEHNNSNSFLQPESSKQPANSSLEGVELNLQMQADFAKSSSKKKARQTPAKVRRSERLQTSAVDTQNEDIERVIEEITLSGSDEEEDPVDAKLPEPTLMGKNLEGKVDYILKMLEVQRKTTDVKFKATKNSFSGNCSGGGDITYKSLYIDSEKKVEALMEENYQLTLKLQNALGKIEAYEKGNPMVCDMLEKFNEILLSQLSSEAIDGNFTAPETGLEHRTAAKRKRLDKQTRGNGHSDNLM
ncbi:hypothetical protein NC652_005568 [Populus alba x Populus x berolinensis]|uniref:Uncharacterized protein n=3 Tax=Populus TaxID=3689 RepID=A0ACC4CRN8_POPAL|nr:uncharacterized protein LOC118049205 [Populus alba]KAG6785921.1 hypothetical protein POTOM_007512 [Populus tomentosa]KAJ6953869.1 hypothetical protein NC652_005568 [Populus alba x Populus x berolinensis]TKS18028.1 uncharacterized protein D5086_0000008770 [Populus alba]